MAIGNYRVAPAVHPTGLGGFLASVTVSSGRGSESRHRIIRFSHCHASPEAAHLVALTQGWLQTCSPRPAVC